ncbi:MAG: ribosomal-processing cysteine protease Prp [Ruminococcaceae bacterium]|nr:ribosomal-processing cysteine protease Prp [Oscillospiraceae bacterium]MBR3598102.1 ribosomal-processing cysteine protease Prp [Clostridia bacterium]
MKEAENTVKIDFYENKDELVLSVSGHAGYAEKGKDIVCAGVSALCLLLKLAVERVSESEGTGRVICNVEDGEFYLSVKELSFISCSEELRTLFGACFAGFSAIEKLYPVNVHTHKLLIPLGTE